MLLQKLVKDDNENKYVVSIQIDENGNEGFVVDHFFHDEIITTAVAEDYTIMSKMLIDYLSKKDNGKIF